MRYCAGRRSSATQGSGSKGRAATFGLSGEEKPLRIPQQGQRDTHLDLPRVMGHLHRVGRQILPLVGNIVARTLRVDVDLGHLAERLIGAITERLEIGFHGHGGGRIERHREDQHVSFHADAARRAVRHRALRQRRPGCHARAAGQEQHILGSRRQRDVFDPIKQLIRPHVGFEVHLAGRKLRLVPFERLELLFHLLGFQRQCHPPSCFIELGGRLVRRIEEQASWLRPLAVVGQIIVDFRLNLIFQVPQRRAEV